MTSKIELAENPAFRMKRVRSRAPGDFWRPVNSSEPKIDKPQPMPHPNLIVWTDSWVARKTNPVTLNPKDRFE